MCEEVSRQAEWLEKAALEPDVIARVRDELAALPTTLPDAERCLISFDTHPGNFLITAEGSAMLVDLEKCRYGLPGIDLAHTSLYTSTTWDVNSQAVLTLEEVIAFISVGKRMWVNHPARKRWSPADVLLGCGH